MWLFGATCGRVEEVGEYETGDEEVVLWKQDCTSMPMLVFLFWSLSHPMNIQMRLSLLHQHLSRANLISECPFAVAVRGCIAVVGFA
jgi:hypothetical protein